VECAICGKKTNKLFKAMIEGSVQEVCESCLKYGQKIEESLIRESPIIKKSIFLNTKEPDLEEDIFLIENYGRIIQEKRKNMGLDRKEFAKKINEKESIIRRIESEEMKPDKSLLYKLEKFLNINLQEKYEKRKFTPKKIKGELTIGDIIEIE